MSTVRENSHTTRECSSVAADPKITRHWLATLAGNNDVILSIVLAIVWGRVEFLLHGIYSNGNE